MCNVELFELYETILTLQMQKILFVLESLKESEGNRVAIQCTLDLLSIQNHVIKKGRLHGHWYGKTKEQSESHIAPKFEKEMHREAF